MEFKSRTALHEHINELVKSGYLIKEWQKSKFMKDGKKFTRMTRIFKINFQNISTVQSRSNQE